MPKFVQVPPDSTGKRISHGVTMHLEYTGGTQDFSIGEVVTAQESGVFGEVGQVMSDSTTESGTLHVILDTESPDTFVIGEDLQVGGVTFAQVASFQRLYAQQVQLVGGNNTTNSLSVDDKGALFTRGAEGVHQYDAFGKLETADRTTIGEYVFTHGTLDEDLDHQTEGNSSIEQHPNFSGIVLSTGSSADDRATTTSHLYHKYQAAIAQTFMATVAIGDNGKTNVTRRWGYFDDQDGLFFELDDDTLYVVVRSSTSGTVEEIRIPQHKWNTDRVNGEGGSFNLSRENLDRTKLTIYWIDFQWLGAGRVRFGTLINGQRITCHATRFKNIGSSAPYMRSGTLPVRFHQHNKDVTASTSEMRVVCCAVSCEGDFSPRYRSFSPDFELPPVEITSHQSQTMFSARTKRNFKGEENRGVILPKTITAYVFGDSPVGFRLVKNGELTDDTWTLDVGPNSITEVDATATDITGGRAVWTTVTAPGQVTEIDLTHIFSYERGETVKRHADIDQHDTFTLMGRLLREGDTNAEVSLAINWVEIT